MTDFDEIEDLALVTINDYRLAKLWEQDEEEFKTYMDGFLFKAVADFIQCKQSLEYSLEERVFLSDLTHREKVILANWIVIEHYARDNDTYALYRQHLQNSGSFKNHSESQNLKENSTYIDKLREEIDRQIVAYQLEDLSIYFE